MTEADVLRAVRDELKAAGLGPLHMRRLSAIDGREGIVIRPSAPRVSAAYIDGTSEVELPVRVICKRREAVRAMADAEDAADALALVAVKVGGDALTITCGPDMARELELSDADFHIWESTATARYEIRPKERS